MQFFSNFRYIEDYPTAIDNSAFISVCWKDDKIVGAGRAISDLSRFCYIVDLNVLQEYQKQGIGKQLVKDLVHACLDAKVRYIQLSTDSQYPWLENFYKNIGFKKVNYSALMEWSRRKE